MVGAPHAVRLRAAELSARSSAAGAVDRRAARSSAAARRGAAQRRPACACCRAVGWTGVFFVNLPHRARRRAIALLPPIAVSGARRLRPPARSATTVSRRLVLAPRRSRRQPDAACTRRPAGLGGAAFAAASPRSPRRCSAPRCSPGGLRGRDRPVGGRERGPDVCAALPLLAASRAGGETGFPCRRRDHPAASARRAARRALRDPGRADRRMSAGAACAACSRPRHAAPRRRRVPALLVGRLRSRRHVRRPRPAPERDAASLGARLDRAAGRTSSLRCSSPSRPRLASSGSPAAVCTAGRSASGRYVRPPGRAATGRAT